jgi:hypothetical protein
LRLLTPPPSPRLFSIRRLIARYQHDLFLVLPFLSVAQMFIVILFLGHLYGCFFYYFSTSVSIPASNLPRFIFLAERRICLNLLLPISSLRVLRFSGFTVLQFRFLRKLQKYSGLLLLEGYALGKAVDG